jgi:hypothetical protein
MTEVGHVLTGAAIGVLSLPGTTTIRHKIIHVIAFMLIATIPDWPIKNWGHDRYYFSHSLFVNLLFIFILFIIFFLFKKFRLLGGSWSVVISGSIAWLSHFLLDTFYNHGKGIMIYWPFSNARLALPIPWFDLGIGSLAHIIQVLLIEFISYFPLVLLALFIRRKWNNHFHQINSTEVSQ